MSLTLEADDVRAPHRWLWRLKSPKGSVLTTHEVELDSNSWEFLASLDLYGFLTQHAPPDRRAEYESRVVRELGEWLGAKVLGPIGPKILDQGTPATVRVVLPDDAKAQGLQFFPLELAHVNGQPLALQDVSLVFEVAGEKPPVAGTPIGVRLRMLAVFSLPVDASALNLRYERHRIKTLIRSIAQTKGRAIEFRVLQYGVTRAALKDILKEQGGWDVLHFSGHGLAAGLVLEKDDGSKDVVSSKELIDLIKPGRSRLKWVTLSACLSAARTVEETLRWLGLEPKRHEQEDRAAADATTGKPPAVARALVANLGCAVLAMRYPVGDDFAINLGQKVYEGVFDDDLPLSRALQSCLPEISDSPLAVGTPALFGQSAAGLKLDVPRADLDHAAGPYAAGLARFPDPPDRFVGRVKPMSQASRALAPRGAQTGVLFHGMSGAGKSACAVELAYHYEDLERFTGFVWYKAPELGSETAGALLAFAQAFESQLSDKDLNPLFPLVHMMEEEEKKFDAYLSRLRKFLEGRSVLLVLDNLESLLRANGEWLEPRWGRLIATLLSHRGESRTVLTSRIRPIIPGLAAGKLLELPIHTLTLGEAALMSRQLPNLGTLLRNDDHRPLVRELLGVVQGHPKLIELAEKQATDPDILREHLARAQAAWLAGQIDAGQLSAFFEQGESSLEAEEFLEALAGWTEAIARHLPAASRTLFHFLCCLEEGDRAGGIVKIVWPNLWKRLTLPGDPPAWTAALEPLTAAGLVEEHIVRDPDGVETGRNYALHPGVAESGRSEAGKSFQTAVDAELSECLKAVFQLSFRGEALGSGPLIIRAGLGAAPYLLRQQCWMEAAHILEQVLHRDSSPTTVAAVLPLFRRIANATDGTEDGLGAAAVFGRSLSLFGSWAEAENLLRDTEAKAVERGLFHVASLAVGNLIILLRDTERAEAAIDEKLIERMQEYTRRAGLGPWTQLSDEAQRLRLWIALDRYEEVLNEIETLRTRMSALSERPIARETSDPWMVREMVIEECGYRAALGLGRWQEALALNAEVISIKQARRATDFELASTRFSNYRTLLELGRLAEARELILSCKAVFEQAEHLEYLTASFCALSDLAEAEGHRDQAITHMQTALRYRYRLRKADQCAACHHNLAVLFKGNGATPDKSIAHRVAATLIWLLVNRNRFYLSLQALLSDCPEGVPDPTTIPDNFFMELCTEVEDVEGVQFAALVDELRRSRNVTGTGYDLLRYIFGCLRVKATADKLPTKLKNTMVRLVEARTAGSEAVEAILQELRAEMRKDHPDQEASIDELIAKLRASSPESGAGPLPE